jgi:DMSO/TMAO reductase YedYZ molybdopterin-dependent catalytic subunit
MNDGDIPTGHGGPLRLRVPRQLGYKSLKFLNRVTLTDTLKGVPLDTEYSWYAGI